MQILIRPILILVCALALGCATRSSDRGYVDDGAGTTGPLLTLTGEGDALRLVGAPADPAYTGVYPNPQEADWMGVYLGRNGELRAECEAFGSEFDCRSNPFHSVVQPLPDGRSYVEVRDLHGHLVAALIPEGTPSGEGDPRADGGVWTDAGGTTPRTDGTRETEPREPAYSGPVGVVVDAFEGSFRGVLEALPTGTPVSATVSGAGERHVRIEIGELSADEEGPELDSSERAIGLHGYVHGSFETAGLPDLMVNVSANGRGYTAHTTRWYHGAITRVERERSADGLTWRLVVDAVWPDESWARLVLRYNGTSTDAPGPMPGLPASPPPSWADFSNGCSLPTDKARFCEGVNTELAAAGQTYRLDCAALPDHPADRAPRSSSDRTADPPFDGCMVIMQEPLRAIGYDEPTTTCQAALVSAWEDYGRVELISNGMCLGSPIVLDLDGDGIALSDPEGGVAFDLFGDGRAVQTAWTTGDDDAFLVLDRDGDGFVAGAAELFGHATAGGRHAHGFEPLAALDEDGDGTLDASDAAFADLAVWIDTDRDGTSDRGEVRPLAAVGVVSLSVRPTRIDGAAARDEHGNELPLTATFTLAGGSERTMADVFLRYRPLASEPAHVAAGAGIAVSESAASLAWAAR